MPTIAVSTFSFGPEGMAREGMDFALEHGFKGLELGSWNHWPDLMSPEDVKYLRVQAATQGIELSIHFIHRGVAPATHVPERRAKHLGELRQTLRLAGDIGARVIVVHPGPLDYPGVGAADGDRRRQWSGSGPLVHRRGVVVLHAEVQRLYNDLPGGNETKLKHGRKTWQKHM